MGIYKKGGGEHFCFLLWDMKDPKRRAMLHGQTRLAVTRGEVSRSASPLREPSSWRSSYIRATREGKSLLACES